MLSLVPCIYFNIGFLLQVRLLMHFLLPLYVVGVREPTDTLNFFHHVPSLAGRTSFWTSS